MQNTKKVRDLLVSISDYPNITENASIKDAFSILKKNFEESKGYRSILVLDEKNQLKGLLSMRNLIQAVEPGFLKATPSHYQGTSPEYPALAAIIWQELFSEQCKKEAEKPVKDIMSPIRATVTLEDPLAKAAYLIVAANTPVLPVIDNNRVVGVIRLIDIFKEISGIVTGN